MLTGIFVQHKKEEFVKYVAALLMYHEHEVHSHILDYEKQILREHTSHIVSCFLAQFIGNGVESLFPMTFAPYGENLAECKGSVEHMLTALGYKEPESSTEAPATELGKAGGIARAQKLSSRRRKEIAQMGAIARWKKYKK